MQSMILIDPCNNFSHIAQEQEYSRAVLWQKHISYYQKHISESVVFFLTYDNFFIFYVQFTQLSEDKNNSSQKNRGIRRRMFSQL